MLRPIPLAAILLLFSAATLAQTAGKPPAADKVTLHNLHESTTEAPLTTAGNRQPATPQGHVSPQDRDRAAALSAKATRLLLANHPGKAMRGFQQAAALDPENPRFAQDATIARENWVTKLVHDAAEEKHAGNRKAAALDLARAAQLAPDNPEVTQHFEEQKAAASAPAIDVQVPAPPVSLVPRPGVHSFHIRASTHQVIQQVMSAWGIQATCDNSVRDVAVPFDTGKMNFQTAEHALELATSSFAVPLDPARALFVPDTAANRAEYQRLAMETVYLPGIDESERTRILEMVRGVFNLQKVTYDAGSHAITIRGPQSRLTALNKTLSSLMQGESQILLDVKLYEISRTRTTDQGVILPSGTTLFNIPSEVRSIINSNQSLVEQIISSGLAAPNDYIAIAALLIASGQVTGTVFNQPFAYFGGGLTATGLTSSGVTGNAKLNSSNVTELDQMQMLALNQQDEEIRSGSRYPIITSSYSNLAGSNLSIPGISSPGISSALAGLGINAGSLFNTQETVPQVQYQNIGLTLHVTPYVEGHGDVTLKLDLKLQTLKGQSINDIPILSNREVNSITSLRPGESALLVSSLTKQDALAVTGIPGINELPGLRGGTNQNRQKNIAELAIIITPHVVRRVHSRRADPMILLPPK
ncbi:MAG: type II secretion system protein GspD [Acidobacteriaceae bacterium]